MRLLLVFLACLAPLVWLIWQAGARGDPPPTIPDEVHRRLGNPVLLPRDLIDERGNTPFHGEILALEEATIKVVDGGHVLYYVQADRLARKDGKPRMEGVRVAVFARPEGGREKLRATIEAPFITSDPVQWLQGGENSPRVASLGGGVVVLDALGRQLASVPNLDIDVRTKRLTSIDLIEAGDPERGFEVRGRGLEADLGLGELTLLSDVEATMTTRTGHVRVTCAGPATLREERAEEGAPTPVHLTLDGKVRFTHPFLDARCERVEATVLRGEKKTTLVRARLLGPLRLEFDPERAGGLEWLEASAISIEGEERVIVEGPFRGGATGPVPSLSGDIERFGDQPFDIEGGGAVFHLLSRERVEGDPERRRTRTELKDALFDRGIEIRERGGPTYFKARWLYLDAIARTFRARNGVEGRTPEGRFGTSSIEGEAGGPGELRLVLKGRSEIEYLLVGDTGLGPLARSAQGWLKLRCKRILKLGASRGGQSFDAWGAVRVDLGDHATLQCDELHLRTQPHKQTPGQQEIASFAAKGSVTVVERERGAELSGDLVTYDGQTALVKGAPAVAAPDPARRVQANELEYSLDGRFRAEGDVLLTSPLDREGKGPAWEVRCAKVSGKLVENKTPEAIRAEGAVRVVGPGGERVEGEVFHYRGKLSRAVLTGTPALLRRGEDLRVEAQGFQIDVDADKGTIRGGDTIGRAIIDISPQEGSKGMDARASQDFKRVHIELAGPAHYDGGESIVVPDGGNLQLFDAKDKLVVDGAAAHVKVLLDPTPGKGKIDTIAVRRVLGSNGVRISGRGTVSTADRFSYEPGSGLIDVEGNARAEGGGMDGTVTWRRLSFFLVKDGIDLKGVRGLEVGQNRPARKPVRKPD